ncbi:MAG: hypothetical protein NVV79_08565 [Devosia ginsengisoli]|nr:hypothetical protein [Devosia ginsengisoli]MCR6671389.1 hypothetical protein [Devosia ginsengisoli]
MVIHAKPLAAQPADQLPQGYPEILGLEIVQRLVDARQRRHGDDAAFEERMPEHHLPQMLDIAWVLPQDQHADILDRAGHRAGLEFHGRLAQPVEPRLVGLDSYEDPVPQPGIDHESPDGGDLHLRLLFASIGTWRRPFRQRPYR